MTDIFILHFEAWVNIRIGPEDYAAFRQREHALVSLENLIETERPDRSDFDDVDEFESYDAWFVGSAEEVRAQRSTSEDAVVVFIPRGDDWHLTGWVRSTPHIVPTDIEGAAERCVYVLAVADDSTWESWQEGPALVETFASARSAAERAFELFGSSEEAPSR